MDGVLDLERLLGRVAMDSAGRARCLRWPRRWAVCLVCALL